jgi:hypothetical protein
MLTTDAVTGEQLNGMMFYEGMDATYYAWHGREASEAACLQ